MFSSLPLSMPKKSRSKSLASNVNPLVLLIGVVVVLLVAGGSAMFSGCVPNGVIINPPPPPVTTAPDQPTISLPRANVSEGTWYTVYFTKPSYPEKKEERSGGVDQALVADFDRATKTIDVAIFDLRLPSLVDALARATARGVKVRAVVDYQANKDAKEFTDAVTKLEKAGVSVIKNERSALMHNKFAVIDGRLLWTGSMNFTPNDVYRNNNNMLRLDNSSLIQNYNQIFERLFLLRSDNAPSKKIPNPRVELENGIVIDNYFSPTGGAQKAILDRLKAAQTSIRVTAFAFTDTEMGKVLKAKHKDKLQVRGIFEKRNNEGLGAEYATLRRAGLDVLEDGNCYILHSKLFIIDDKTVIMGSYNFTDAANKTNDENLLIIDDPALAQRYIAEFDRIYKQAQAPTACGS
jgi:phosphatidylserine/phosphatidylglycerophosphate/cardiolipin synthase-like enzyme